MPVNPVVRSDDAVDMDGREQVIEEAASVVDLTEPERVAVALDGLDGTMARSVDTFLSARHADRFAVVPAGDARVLIVDLDQPGAEALVGAADPSQVVLAIGFSSEAGVPGCDRYVQKPLTGGALVDALAEVAGVAVRTPTPHRPAWADRPSHARDVFTKGRAWEPAAEPAPRRRAPAWDAEPPRRLHRAVHAPSVRRDAVVGATHRAADAADALSAHHDPVEFEPEPTGAREDGELIDPTVLAACRYDPTEHLDGRLREAARAFAGHRWEIRGPGLVIVGGPDDESVVISGSRTRLRQACLRPLDATWTTTRLRHPHGDDPTDTWERHPLTTVQWETALWCSQGRLPRDVDPWALLAIRAWPDLTRCARTGSTLAVVALLADGPQRPADLPDLLGITRAQAFAVVAALDGVGLLQGPGHGSVLEDGLSHRPPPSQPARATGVTEPGAPWVGLEPIRPPSRGLLRRLIGRLRDA